MFTKGLDSILGTFTKVQKDLENFINTSATAKEQLKTDVMDKEAQITELNIDIAKAGHVLGNVRQILGED